MTRHGRNATASAVYTYHEKKKDSGEALVAVAMIVCVVVP